MKEENSLKSINKGKKMMKGNNQILNRNFSSDYVVLIK